MTLYPIGDGKYVDPSSAVSEWGTDTDADVGTLYCSSRGTYYVIRLDFTDSEVCEVLSAEEAAKWLVETGHEIPDDLVPFLSDDVEVE